jgi:hypothetical protein
LVFGFSKNQILVAVILDTKTDLVFGFSKNQILVAVILGQNSFWIIAKNHFEMSIITFY